MAGHVLAGLVRNETPEALAHDYVERLAVFGLGVCCPTPAADNAMKSKQIAVAKSEKQVEAHLVAVCGSSQSAWARRAYLA